MPTTFFLTDEDSDISGYLRLKLGARSDAPSLVRAVTDTVAGATSGFQITRSAGGATLQWISDPLDGTDLAAVAWEFHVWAKESAAAANAAPRFQVYRYSNAEAGSAALDDNNGTELGTTVADTARTTGAATITTLNDGDRLVVKLLLDDASGGSMAAGYTVTVSYNGQYAKAEGDSYVICPDTLAVTAAMPTTTRTKVRRMLKDTDSSNPFIADAEIDQSFDEALRTYSNHRPRLVANYLSGDGSSYQFRLPRLWIGGFSRVLEIEYPTGEQPRATLEPSDAEVVTGVLGPQPTRLLTFKSTPESGTDNLLLRYTTRHLHTDETDTIEPQDVEPVMWLAASYAAEKAAAKSAGASDSTINADSVNYRDGEQRWRSVAKSYRERYDRHIAGDGGVKASGAWVDWDTNATPYGQDRLIHRRRWR